MLIVFLVFFVISKLFIKDSENTEDEITMSNIYYSNNDTNIYVEYPRFKSDKINAIITNIIYSYVKEFKSSDVESKALDVSYNIYKIKEYVNITFNIQNTLNNIKNKNILIDTSKEELAYITNIYDKDYLKNEINDLVYYKYSQEIYDTIKDENINNFTYIIDDDKIDIYFNNLNFNLIDYIPYVTIKTNTDEEVSYTSGNKFIAFTFDDGPSEYTNDLLKTLEANNASATFFMIGNRMRAYKDTVLNIYNSNSEIGSHSYSHKNLTEIDEKELEIELNTPELIYNEITSDNITLLRPPYGKYNDLLLNSNYNIVLWNIDPKDWLLRDSKKIYNNVISNACDGCIVIFHDIYPETIDAIKMILPKLTEMNYSVVNISKLMEIKTYDANIKEPISYIN
jgi:peptidoglycan/xylan/chitin deacetylase (PgdA/CDA1 family)